MASKSSVEIKIIAQDDASAPIENVIGKTKELGAENKKVTKQSKKDWGGLTDLFGKVLPRDMQGLIRGFKGTQRQVGRLSRSFKALKAAWASIGIGLILIALEELISNWEKYSEMLGITNAAEEKNKKTKDEIIKQQRTLTAEMQGYLEIVANVNSDEERRAVALDAITNSLGNYVDAEADAITQSKQAQDILDAKLLLMEKERWMTENADNLVKQQTETEKGLAKVRRGLASEDAGFFETLADQKIRLNKELESADARLTKGTTELADAQAAYNKLIGVSTSRQEEAAEAERKAAEAQREAEAAYNKRIQKEKANAEWLAGERVRIAEEASLRIIEDDEKRELASLLIEQKKAEQELVDKGGAWQDLLRLGEEYEAERTAITDRYAEERKAQEDADKMQDEADALELKTQLQTDQQNELDEIARFFAEKRLLTEKDSEDYQTLVQQEADAVDAINTKYRNKEEADRKKEQNAKIAGAIAYGNAVRGVVGGISDLMDENAKEQKALAITEVLLAQAISIAQAIKGANSAGSNTGVAAPVVTPLLVIQMVGSVLAGFAGVKKILNEAGASGGGGVSGGSFGGGGGSSVASMASNVQVPLPARLDSPDAMQAYVVQSQLDGQLQSQAQLQGQVVL
jgi:hypothetical protein